jgi:hypothetical protein
MQFVWCLGQLNPKANRIELDPNEEDLNEWAQLNMKVSCDDCSINEDDICSICGPNLQG